MENNCCVQERQLGQIIARLIAAAARQNSSQNVAIRFRELEETAYWLELLVDGKIVSPEKLAALRHECDELLAIFVTIIKRSKNTS